MADILVALGGAQCVWDDFEAAKAILDGHDYDVGAVNDAGYAYPGHLTLWATLHQEKFAAWQRHRERTGLNQDYVAVTRKAHREGKIDKVVGELWSGSSGLYICQVAIIDFGYSHVVCCGIPLDEMPHFFNRIPWTPTSTYRRGWTQAYDQPELKGRIKSMSGWTRDLVGHATQEWLSQ